MSAELDSLMGEAAAVDSLNAPVEFVDTVAEEQAAQLAGNEASELAALLSIVSGLFSPVFPSLAKIYTPDTVRNLADSFVPVMIKHGWSTGGILGRFGEEVAFCAVAFPVAMATYTGIKSDVDAANGKQDEVARVKAVEQVEQVTDQPVFMARG